ncbi:MAG: L,D-transpeptidase family protein [Pseudomonadota bacterium]
MNEGADHADPAPRFPIGNAVRSRAIMKRLLWVLLALFPLLVACVGPAQRGEAPAIAGPGAAMPGPPPTPSSTEEALQALLSAKPSPLAIGEQECAALERFYAARAYRPLWVGAAGLEPAGTMLLARLTQIRNAGGPAISDRLSAAAMPAQQPVADELAKQELLLSAAYLQTAVDPRDPASFASPSKALVEAAAASDKRSFLRRWLPLDPAFWRLRAALQTYQAIQARGGWPSVPAGPKLVLGDQGARVEALRRRLWITGDLTETGTRLDSFDAALEAAVKRFQRRHGLAADGVVGVATLEALNLPVARRLDTITVNLMRLRQQQREWGPRYIAVNAAAATYRLVDGGRQIFDKAAIVGRRSWPTPQIDSLIDRLEFNPYWVVPPRIERLELLPKIQRDPDYMRRHDMHWVGGQIRQDPGPQNPLGVVKFLFPNPYDVYLHDTNNRKLFERQDRFLSHGCIRIADALSLATYLLKDDPQWSPDRIAAVVKAGRNLQVRLVDPIPVHVVYDTAWVDESGAVQFRDDVYGRDRLVAPSLPKPADHASSSSCKG